MSWTSFLLGILLVNDPAPVSFVSVKKTWLFADLSTCRSWSSCASSQCTRTPRWPVTTHSDQCSQCFCGDRSHRKTELNKVLRSGNAQAEGDPSTEQAGKAKDKADRLRTKRLPQSRDGRCAHWWSYCAEHRKGSRWGTRRAAWQGQAFRCNGQARARAFMLAKLLAAMMPLPWNPRLFSERLFTRWHKDCFWHNWESAATLTALA